MSTQPTDLNKKEAKVPDEESDWQSIDIYLFSNGQQYSPPRKYHLRASELNLWGSTLNHLARSHYGSLHSVIELYTLDGQRISGPLDLRDGMPYVAVVPPDSFMDSGYARYLIKASRSWEKRQRQAKTPSINDISQEKNIEAEKACLEVTCEPEINVSQKAIPEVPVVEALGQPQNDVEPSILYATTTSDLATIKTPDENFPAPSVNAADIQPRSIIASPKVSINTQNEKKRSSVQRTSFMKTPNPNCSAQVKKNSLNESLHRKALTKIPIKVTKVINSPAINCKKSNQTKSPTKTGRKPPTLPPEPNKPSDAISQKTTLTYQIPNDKGIVTESLPITNLVDKEIVVLSTGTNLFKTVESEIGSEKLDILRGPNVDEVASCCIPPISTEKEVQSHVEQATNEMNTTDTGLPLTNDKVRVFPAAAGQHSNIITCDLPMDDNYIAVINKGVAVNLTINMEVPNAEPSQSVNQIHKASSLMNVFKRSKPPNEEELTQTQSLQSIISCINDIYAKVVVIQCGCCGNNQTVPRLDTMPVYKDENGFFILMPTPVQGDQRCSCSSNDTHFPNNLCVPIDDGTHHNDKTKSGMCIGELSRLNADTVISNEPQNVGIAMVVNEVVGLSPDRLNPINVRDMRMMQRVCINEDQCNIENCCSSGVVSKGLSGNSVMESYTQTDWCTAMLEVKRHEDGRYSFHLPPLNVLKYYSLT